MVIDVKERSSIPCWPIPHQSDMRHNMDVTLETYLNYTPISIEALIGKKGKTKNDAGGSLRPANRICSGRCRCDPSIEGTFWTELGRHTKSFSMTLKFPCYGYSQRWNWKASTWMVFSEKALCRFGKRTSRHWKNKFMKKPGEPSTLHPQNNWETFFSKNWSWSDKPKNQKRVQYSTAEDVLSLLAKDHKIIRDILVFGGLSKLKSTHVDALPEQVELQHGAVHTDHLQTVCSHGRLGQQQSQFDKTFHGGRGRGA